MDKTQLYTAYGRGLARGIMITREERDDLDFIRAMLQRSMGPAAVTGFNSVFNNALQKRIARIKARRSNPNKKRRATK